MRISTPLTSNARKQRVVIQWVMRTMAECREVTVVVRTAELEIGTQTESATREWYQTLRTPGEKAFTKTLQILNY